MPVGNTHAIDRLSQRVREVFTQQQMHKEMPHDREARQEDKQMRTALEKETRALHPPSGWTAT